MASASRAPSWLRPATPGRRSRRRSRPAAASARPATSAAEPTAPAGRRGRRAGAGSTATVISDAGPSSAGGRPRPAEGALAPSASSDSTAAGRPIGRSWPRARGPGPCSSAAVPSSLTNPAVTAAASTAARMASADHSREASSSAMAAVEHLGRRLAPHHRLVHDGARRARLVVEEEVDHRPTSVSRRTRSCTSRRGRQRRGGRVAAGEERPARSRNRRGRARMYSALTCCSFLHVEERRRRGDVLQAELLDDLLERTDLDAVARPPPEQGEVVDHRLGQEALGPKSATETASLRFESFLRPSFTSIGRWANTSGRPSPSARGAGGTSACRSRGPRPG